MCDLTNFIYLNKIKSPADIKSMTVQQLEQLCAEIREFLINTIADTGGHLASNLGVVELTVALHKVFDSPEDKLIFDVGHQCYTHKLLTGRLQDFHTLRQEGGISGFPRHKESEHDAFIGGHASTSISAACGLSAASILSGSNNHVAAVIGDGSFTGGMAYEALNNSGNLNNLIVVLNHNEMSISKNVGSFARYIASLRIQPFYVKFRRLADKTMEHIPIIGKRLKKAVLSSKSAVKNLIFNANLFTDMGFVYYGPVDGHDIGRLINVFEQVKTINQPVFLDIDTVKGKGYCHAEDNPGAFHGVAAFDVETGNPDISEDNSFSTVFGKRLTELAGKDEKICAITAAMKYGTGLQHFYAAYKNRFFDVGIAEQHAVTFAGGLAAGGMTPVFAVYSSFLQRGYDQIIHDTAIEGQHVVFAVDRAGIVGSDGETHQGIFDTAFLSAIPNVTVYAPSSYRELEIYLDKAIYETPAVAAVRYPRGGEPEYVLPQSDGGDYTLVPTVKESDILLVTYGRLYSNVYAAALLLKEQNINAVIMKINKIVPLNPEAIKEALNFKRIYFYEEGVKSGGIGEHFLSGLNQYGYKGEFTLQAIDNQFIPACSAKSALVKLGLDGESIYKQVLKDCMETKTAAGDTKFAIKH